MAKAAPKANRKKGGKFFFLSGDFWAHTFFKVLIAVLVCVGGWMLISMARDRCVKFSDFQVSPQTLELLAKPRWVRGPIEKQLKVVPGADGKVSLLDPAATRKIASGLAANPWVKEVKSVKREFPNRVRAEVSLRDPAAFVLRGNSYYIVDAEGVRLPGEYKDRADTGLDLLIISYVRTSPPPAGKVWDDPAVVEGARVAAFLKPHADVIKAARVAAIDTSNIGGRRTPREPEIVLITAGHTQVYWGRGVHYPGSTELSPARKLENLKAVLRQEGSLTDKEYVDLRFPNPVFRDRKFYLSSL